jgi:hypothetical protein
VPAFSPATQSERYTSRGRIEGTLLDEFACFMSSTLQQVSASWQGAAALGLHAVVSSVLCTNTRVERLMTGDSPSGTKGHTEAAGGHSERRRPAVFTVGGRQCHRQFPRRP